jgi:hypothetical protein
MHANNSCRSDSICHKKKQLLTAISNNSQREVNIRQHRSCHLR